MNRRHTKLCTYHTSSKTLKPTKCTFNCQVPQNISRSLFIHTEAASQSVYQRLYRSERRPGRGAECFGVSNVHAGLTFILYINWPLKLWWLFTGTTNWGLLPGRNKWNGLYIIIQFPNYKTQSAIHSEITLLKPSGHYMYRTVVTVCTAQWSLYVPHSDHYMYRQFKHSEILRSDRTV
jgi:hypothetical protein